MSDVPLNALARGVQELQQHNDAMMAMLLEQQQRIEALQRKIQETQDRHYAQFLEDEEMLQDMDEDDEDMDEDTDEDTDEDDEDEEEEEDTPPPNPPQSPEPRVD
ncbi:hypothetical protein RHMOL_Rhmol07G0061900 [Rhododendron molle]|uniref:Uncharacterized protein n=1 Tax=Rhododendron molle TaxID=49168 RepID=A0ACC0MXU7_RHOML|nr:hypothetical protein RHMOL_Rhmol07G0061900 [Rhododendron molle]